MNDKLAMLREGIEAIARLGGVAGEHGNSDGNVTAIRLLPLIDELAAEIPPSFSGIILRIDVDGMARVFIQTAKSDVEIISSYAEDTIIDHWVNWSTVLELTAPPKGGE